MEPQNFSPITKRVLKARETASSVAARKSDAREVLEELVAGALGATGGEIAFLIIPSRQDPYAIHTVKTFDGRTVGAEHNVVSRELIDNARDMKDAVISMSPFDVLVGVRGTYELKRDTLFAIPGLRSAIAAPLHVNERFVGALVIHERNRSEPFTLDDRRILEPFVTFAAKTIAESLQKLHDEVAATLERKKLTEPPEDGLVGIAPRFLEVVEQADLVANSVLSVLITGESGTGKELFAHRIHAKSPRRKGPFVAVNVGCLGELVVAELFGYKKGAFTGANVDKKGLIEEADGGTIFLDEFGELDKRGQVALLRFLQERKIRPLGGVEKKVDVRIVAATNRDVDAMVVARTFQLDLLMRISPIRLELPPLRERKEDIRLLAASIVDKVSAQNGRRSKPVAAPALARLMEYDWPGNVRELENVLSAAVIYSKGATIDEDVIRIRPKTVDAATPGQRTLTAAEKGYIRLAVALRSSISEDKDEVIRNAKISRTSYFEYLKAGKEVDPDRSSLPEWFREQQRD